MQHKFNTTVCFFQAIGTFFVLENIGLIKLSQIGTMYTARPKLIWNNGIYGNAIFSFKYSEYAAGYFLICLSHLLSCTEYTDIHRHTQSADINNRKVFFTQTFIQRKLSLMST